MGMGIGMGMGMEMGMEMEMEMGMGMGNIREGWWLMVDDWMVEDVIVVYKDEFKKYKFDEVLPFDNKIKFKD